jgi:hypothetical protein
VRALPVVLALTPVLALAARADAQGAVAVSTIQLPRDLTVRDVLLADADGDEREDLLVVAAGADRRSIRVHRRRAAPPLFTVEPDAIVDLPGNVVACAVGDVHPRPGAELVLFARQGVFAVWMTPAEGGGEREGGGARLFEADLLWQLPQEDDVVLWQHGLDDLDGDTRADIVVPRPGGFTVAFRDGSDGGFRIVSLDVPPSPPLDLLDPERRRGGPGRSDDSFETTLNLGDDAGVAPLLSVSDDVPSPHAADWDGDGDLDLVAQTKTSLLVWVQEPRGTFAGEPTHVHELPVALDWATLDVSFRSHLGDLNGDRRADYVLIANDRFSKETRAQVLPYLQPAGAGALFEGTPRALLPSGFVPVSGLRDVDGDGRLDLVLGTFRPESMRPGLGGGLGGRGGNGAVPATLFVYRNDGRGFAPSPMLRHDMRLALGGGDSAARLLVDLTGDGVRDLVIRDTPELVRVLPVQRGRDGTLSVRDRPIWRLDINEDAEIEWADVGADRGELLVVEETQVMHVRLR